MAPTWLNLIGKGLGMGVVHVLTGPDHMSALATLSANGGCGSFKYGIRWGIGHSTGLVIVGIFMIALSSGEDKIDMSRGVSIFLESIVGIFMLLLGCYSILKARRRKKLAEHNLLSQHSDSTPQSGDHGELMDDATTTPPPPPTTTIESNNDESIKSEIELGNVAPSSKVPSFDHHHHHHHHGEPLLQSNETMKSCGQLFMKICCPLTMCKTGVYNIIALLSSFKLPKQVLAVLVGVVHGVAGPGGVLGVIPAVNLHDWRLATVYLTTFCIASTTIMGLFASTYGVCSQRVSSATNFEYQMELFSASLSIIVGILWIILLAVGKLHDIFP